MTRREFLHSAAAGAAAAAATSTQRASIASGQTESHDAHGVPPFELEDASLAQLRLGMESGRYTARSIAELYLGRIEAVNQRGPTLRAVLETNPDALEIADALDAERKARGPRGPLHGIPILLKDNIDTADRMTTTAGSLALEGSIAANDAYIARKLRQAGAVLLGKANLSEWANFRSSHSTSGWSGRGRQARNPYALDRQPSGSSSGSGIAAAASLCAAAIGTETDGSIVSPSSHCSVVGIKPTVGLLSRSGIIPISRSQDTAGPMARTVEDAAILLGAMAGVDPADDATAASDGRFKLDYTPYLKKDGLKGARIGLVRAGNRGALLGAQKLLDAALAAIKSEGGTIIEDVTFPELGRVGGAEQQVLLYEFKDGLNAYLSKLSGDFPRTLAALIAFNDKHADRELPFFGQEMFQLAQAKGGLESEEYVKALASCREATREKGIDVAMDKHQLDALVALSAGPPALIDLVLGDYGSGGSSTLAAVAGYPSICVPAGYVYGLPVGISFFGRAFSEPTLLRIAYAFEQVTQARKPPRFPSSAPLPA